MTSQRGPAWTQEELMDVGVAITLALSSSMDPEVVSPKRWWARLQSAIQTSAERSYSWPQLTSAAAKSLQIGVLSRKTASVLCSTGRDHGLEGARFEALRTVLERDAHFIVALARAERDARKRGDASVLSPRMARKLDEAKIFTKSTKEDIL